MWNALTSSEMIAALGGVLVAEIFFSAHRWWSARKERAAVRRLIEMEIARDWVAFCAFWGDVMNREFAPTESEANRSHVLALRFVERSFPVLKRSAWNNLMAKIPETLSLSELNRVDHFYTLLDSLQSLYVDMVKVKQGDDETTRAAPGHIDRAGLPQRAQVLTKFPRYAPEHWPRCQAIGEQISAEGPPFASTVTV